MPNVSSNAHLAVANNIMRIVYLGVHHLELTVSRRECQLRGGQDLRKEGFVMQFIGDTTFQLAMVYS